MPKPLIRVKNKKGDYIYVESDEPRPCTITHLDFYYHNLCNAYQISRTDFINYELKTRVFTDCLQYLQGWKEIPR